MMRFLVRASHGKVILLSLVFYYMRYFTSKELARFNGQDGSPAYVAVYGKVYDVSNSSLWRNGKHQITHFAGKDLTEALERAPHSIDYIETYPLMGTLIEIK
jgi:predicted heme/steroid binding protein